MNLFKRNMQKGIGHIGSYRLLMSVAAMLMVGCSGERKKEIPSAEIEIITLHTDRKEVLGSTLFDSVQYIALNNDINIGAFPTITVLEEYLLVHDGFTENPKILLFGMDGQFIRQISSLGRSGSEHSAYFRLLYEPSKKELIIFDFERNVFLFFNLEGTFIRSFPIEKFLFDRALLVNDRILLYDSNPTLNNFDGFSHFQWIDLDGQVISKHKIELSPLVKPLSTEEMRKGYYPMSNSFSKDQEDIIYISSTSDTVFRLLNDNTLEPKMSIKVNIPSDWPSYIVNPDELPILHFNFIRLGHLLYFPRISINRVNSLIVYDTQTKESYNLGHSTPMEISREYSITGWVNDLDGGSPIGGGITTFLTDKGTKLIQNYTPLTFKKLLLEENRPKIEYQIQNQEAHQRLIQWASTLSDDGNPIVQITHIKKEFHP
jgi:hypothetical protein